MPTVDYDSGTVWYTTTWAGSDVTADDDCTWTGWNDMGTATTTSITWDGWNQSATVWINGQPQQGVRQSQLTQQLTTSSSQVWGQWNIQCDGYIQCDGGYVLEAPPETDEQRAARLERERQWQEREKERVAKAQEAEARAKELLESMLTPEQIAQLRDKSEFEVVSQSGKRYAIAKGTAGNVHSLDEHRRKVARHCIHPEDSVPCWDAMLSQMLWLKWNEAAFLKTANTTPLRIAA